MVMDRVGVGMGEHKTPGDRFAAELAATNHTRTGTGISVSPDGQEVICYVPPAATDKVDSLADDHGLTLDDAELTRRVYRVED